MLERRPVHSSHNDDGRIASRKRARIRRGERTALGVETGQSAVVMS